MSKLKIAAFVVSYVLAFMLGITFYSIYLQFQDHHEPDQVLVDADGAVSDLNGLPEEGTIKCEFTVEQRDALNAEIRALQEALVELNPEKIALELEKLNDKEQTRLSDEFTKLDELRIESENLSVGYLPAPPSVTGPTQTFYNVVITPGQEDELTKVTFNELTIETGPQQIAWAPVFKAWMTYLHWDESFPAFKLGETMVELYGSTELERELLAKGKQIVQSEDSLWVIGSWLSKQDAATAVLHGGGLSHLLAGELQDYWSATYEDPIELKRQVDYWGATNDISTEYSWYRNQGNPDYAYRAGRVMRRWHEAGGGQAGDDLMVLYRYHIVGIAFWAGPEVVNADLVKSWAAQVNREIDGTNLEYKANYKAELRRIIDEGYPPIGS